MNKPGDQEVDAIAAALAAMRSGRGGPRGMHPGWGPGMRGGPFAHRGHPAAESDDHRAHGGRHAAGPARMRMLDALAASKEPMSISEIAEVVGVDQPRASRLVQQAEMMGLVLREADPQDARRTRVALTDQGRKAVAFMRNDRHDRIGAALEQFTPQERADFARLFTKFAAAWSSR